MKLSHVKSIKYSNVMASVKIWIQIVSTTVGVAVPPLKLDSLVYVWRRLRGRAQWYLPYWSPSLWFLLVLISMVVKRRMSTTTALYYYDFQSPPTNQYYSQHVAYHQLFIISTLPQTFNSLCSNLPPWPLRLQRSIQSLS